MLKPIETLYNGYRFRSRLEARWAVFFDALDIEYEYEPEGYDLGPAGWYLPDFYLRHQNCYAEIKPRGRLMYNLKCDRLSFYSERTVLHIGGNPWPGEYGIIVYDSENGNYTELMGFALDEEGGLWCADDDWSICLNPTEESSHGSVLHDRPALLRAYEEARRARFEHGETAKLVKGA